MSAAFHRGTTQELRSRLQTAGIRIEEQDAQRLLAGSTVVGASSAAQVTIREIANSVWDRRFTSMPRWENDHPDQSPFPPIFAEVVLSKLRQASIDGTIEDVVVELIRLAEEELEL